MKGRFWLLLQCGINGWFGILCCKLASLGSEMCHADSISGQIPHKGLGEMEFGGLIAEEGEGSMGLRFLW